VLSTAQSYLSIYRDPVVAKNVSHPDFRIRDLMQAKKLTTLHFVTEPVDKDRLKPLIRVLVNMIVRISASGLSFEGGMPKANYKHRLLLMLDEFRVLGKLEILQESLPSCQATASKPTSSAKTSISCTPTTAKTKPLRALATFSVRSPQSH
jgi:type IV secretion system protein VirD4